MPCPTKRRKCTGSPDTPKKKVEFVVAVVLVLTLVLVGVDASRLFAKGKATKTVDAFDFAPGGEASGKGRVARFEDDSAHVFRDGKAIAITGYVAGPQLDSGTEASAYAGADIANTNGDGPEGPAKVDDAAKVGQFTSKTDCVKTVVVGHKDRAAAVALNIVEPVDAESVAEVDLVAVVGDVTAKAACKQIVVPKGRVRAAGPLGYSPHRIAGKCPTVCRVGP